MGLKAHIPQKPSNCQADEGHEVDRQEHEPGRRPAFAARSG